MTNSHHLQIAGVSAAMAHVVHASLAICQCSTTTSGTARHPRLGHYNINTAIIILTRPLFYSEPGHSSVDITRSFLSDYCPFLNNTHHINSSYTYVYLYIDIHKTLIVAIYSTIYIFIMRRMNPEVISGRSSSWF